MNKVTLTGLEPGSVDHYQAGGKAISRLETRDPDSFSFIFVGGRRSAPPMRKRPKNQRTF